MKLLTQYIYINAWLDCSSPFISLHKKADDDLFAYFNTDKVNRILDSGDITLEDLQSTNLKTQSSTIKYLIALDSVEKIKRQIKSLNIEATNQETNVTPINKYRDLFSFPTNFSQAN